MCPLFTKSSLITIDVHLYINASRCEHIYLGPERLTALITNATCTLPGQSTQIKYTNLNYDLTTKGMLRVPL